jgi:hypothetical protein
MRLIYMRKLGNGGEDFSICPCTPARRSKPETRSPRRHDFGSARKDFSLFMGVDTFVDVYFAFGYDTLGSTALYLSAGRGY